MAPPCYALGGLRSAARPPLATSSDLRHAFAYAHNLRPSLILDRDATGYRVQEAVGAGRRDLSPRASAAVVAVWLRGFALGLELTRLDALSA